MSEIRIRLARGDDADGILDVYAPYIDTPVTFEEDVPDRAAFRARVEDVLASYPYLVAEMLPVDAAGAGAGGAAGSPDAAVPVPTPASGRIVGYAYAHAQHPRAAYRWNAELSVYLAHEAQGRGLGGTLYRALIELLAAQGMKAVYGLVTVPNPASERLHEAFGFRIMGVQPHAGFTCGAWHDVTWYVRALAPYEDDPVAPTPFPHLAAQRPDLVADVLAHANARLRAGR